MLAADAFCTYGVAASAPRLSTTGDSAYLKTSRLETDRADAGLASRCSDVCTILETNSPVMSSFRLPPLGDSAAHRIGDVCGRPPDPVDDAAETVADAFDQRVVGLVEAVPVVPGGRAEVVGQGGFVVVGAARV